jgi:hypothetical protein
MSLADWDVYTSNTGLGLSINVLTPILSLGSGRFGGTSLGGGLNSIVINPTVASGRTSGVTRGKFRSLFRYDDFTAGAKLGIAFMQSNKNIAEVSSTFYKAELLQSDGKLYLIKATGTTIGGGGTLASVYFSPGINTVFCLEVEWIVDLGELGGTALFLRRGFATDYSDLTTVISYLDVSSPLTTSVAESLYLIEQSAGGVFNLDFDQTALFVP